MSDPTTRLREALDRIAKAFHDNYERLAPSFGYETRQESAKPWADVPEQNKALMRATIAAALPEHREDVLAHLGMQREAMDDVGDLFADEWPLGLGFFEWEQRRIVAGELTDLLDRNGFAVFAAPSPSTEEREHGRD